MSWRMSATIHKINPTSSSTNPLMMVLRCFMQGGYHTAAIPNASRCYGSPHPEKLQYMATMGLDFPADLARKSRIPHRRRGCASERKV